MFGFFANFESLFADDEKGKKKTIKEVSKMMREQRFHLTTNCQWGLGTYIKLK